MRLGSFVAVSFLMLAIIPHVSASSQIVVLVYTNASSYNSGDAVTIYGFVRGVSGFPIPFASVSIQVNDANGSPLHITSVTALSDGSYSNSFNLPMTAASGLYTVFVTASQAPSGVSGSGTAYFTVPRTSLGAQINQLFTGYETLGFEETTNIYDNSGAGFMIAHRAGLKVIFTFNDAARVNPTTHQLTFLDYQNAVLVGGRNANPTTKFYEDQNLARLTAIVNPGGTVSILHNGGVVFNVPLSSITSTNDYFTMQVFNDGTHLVVVLWGIQQYGTLASGVYFDMQFSNLASLNQEFYIIHWQDTNGNSIPDSGDAFTIVYSGT